MTFGSRLKKLRLTKNLTQNDLAKEFNVTRQAVAKWENGSSKPSIEIVEGLAEYFDVSIDYLLSGIEITKEQPKRKWKLKALIITLVSMITASIFLLPIFIFNPVEIKSEENDLITKAVYVSFDSECIVEDDRKLRGMDIPYVIFDNHLNNYFTTYDDFLNDEFKLYIPKNKYENMHVYSILLDKKTNEYRLEKKASHNLKAEGTEKYEITNKSDYTIGVSVTVYVVSPIKEIKVTGYDENLKAIHNNLIYLDENGAIANTKKLSFGTYSLEKYRIPSIYGYSLNITYLDGTVKTINIYETISIDLFITTNDSPLRNVSYETLFVVGECR